MRAARQRASQPRAGGAAAAQRFQGVHRGVDDVEVVVGADALGKHIVNAGTLDDRANGAAGDDAGTRRGGAQKHPTGAVHAELLVRDRGGARADDARDIRVQWGRTERDLAAVPGEDSYRVKSARLMRQIHDPSTRHTIDVRWDPTPR